MGSQLHQALRSLCFNTEWKYAVFWKLKHRARMMLTWEDAYYDCHEQQDPSENKFFGEIVGGRYSHDPLGLVVAKMSCQVYSLGEGIVGQVAATGKHMWIFSDKHATESSSSFEYSDGWKTQFLAGIMTIAVVAVVPHGVVQLGSLNKIAEDLKLVNHIRDIFFGLQDSLVECVSGVIQCSVEGSSCRSDVCTRNSGSGNVHDFAYNLDGAKDLSNIWSPMFTSLGNANDHSHFVSLPGDCSRKTTQSINKHGATESTSFLQAKSEIFLMEQHKELLKKLVSERSCEGETVGIREMDSEDNVATTSVHSFNSRVNLYNATLPAGNLGVDIVYFPSDALGCNNPDGVLCVPELPDGHIQKDSKENLELSTEFGHADALNSTFKFSAGCELYEALGPAFKKHNSSCDWEAEAKTDIEMPEGLDSSSLLTTNSGSEDLLEAVVANVCCSDVKSEKSFCESVQSLLTGGKMSGPLTSDTHTIHSASYSNDQSSLIKEDPLHSLTSPGVCSVSLNSYGACGASLNSSAACGVRSSKGFSSTNPSTCSEQLERPHEPGKINKKRARSGENCRPRPRDRQLIQDRIKELRELVPNGSKCSIDSLLERTIKHMLFMQSMTKHADKLSKCAELKLLDKETGVRGPFNCEQGSSWAVEVGSHLKVCPIIVENINMNGQMLVEMCEACHSFLEIAEAIRSLGLTILKGVTEAYGEKTWMSFVVEGQNNRNMHRMDILWSLVQILQPRTKT